MLPADYPPAAVPETIKLASPFRRAVLRGLAFVLPPLLTLVLFIWAWTVIERYLLQPLENIAATTIVWSIKDSKKALPADLDPAEVKVEKDGRTIQLDELLGDAEPAVDLKAQVLRKGARVKQFQHAGRVYVAVRDRWIPEFVYKAVDANPGEYVPTTANKYYDRYVRLTYLKRTIVVPVFICAFTLILYMTGKFVAAGIGRFFFNVFERLIHRMPIIRDVYAGVKQMTDVVLSEQEVQFRRVVAVEYPRKGMWALAFVTGEGFRRIREEAGEPIYSLLIPTSPVPATGFAVNVRRSECIELDITIDQAVQYTVSFGVVVPGHQQWQKKEENARLAAEVSDRMQAAIAQREAMGFSETP